MDIVPPGATIELMPNNSFDAAAKLRSGDAEFNYFKLSRLEENLGGANIRLSAEDVVALEAASSAINLEGERYPSTHAKLIDR